MKKVIEKYILGSTILFMLLVVVLIVWGIFVREAIPLWGVPIIIGIVFNFIAAFIVAEKYN